MAFLGDREVLKVMTSAVCADDYRAGPVVAVPELEVFQPVIEPVPIDVMNGFVPPKSAAKGPCHNQPVLHHVPVGVCHRVSVVNNFPVSTGFDPSLSAASVPLDPSVWVSLVHASTSVSPSGEGCTASTAALAFPGAGLDVFRNRKCHVSMIAEAY